MWHRSLLISIILPSLMLNGISAAAKVADEHGDIRNNSQRSTLVANPELARVAIVRYEDKTESKNFGYMPDSLTEAIDKSLQRRFEYQRENPKKTAATIAEFKKKHPEIDADDAVDFCRMHKTDILILGKFEFDVQKNEIVVRTSISLGVQVFFRTLKERRNPVDATIFGLADLVADDIVQMLVEIAREQVQKKNLSAKEQKLQLYRSQVVTWVEPNWNLFMGGVATIPLSPSFTNYRSMQPQLSLLVEHRIYRKFFVGCSADASRIRAAGLGIDVVAGAALVGYHLHVANRWDIFVLAGGGYYFGKYANTLTCTAACPSSANAESFTIYNPYATSRLGVNFLMTHWLSLSAFAQGGLFFDKPQPLYFAGGGLAVGFHF